MDIKLGLPDSFIIWCNLMGSTDTMLFSDFCGSFNSPRGINPNLNLFWASQFFIVGDFANEDL